VLFVCMYCVSFLTSIFWGLLESERFDKIIKKEGNFLGTKFGSFMKERGLIIRRTKLEIHEERFDHRGKKEKVGALRMERFDR
jgi:hypothetical protein